MAVGESSSILQTAGGASKRPRSPDAAAQVQDEEADEDVKEKPEEPDEHLTTFRSDVVGVQYYRGLVGKGEYVLLRREPHNKYDANAVQVVNAGGTQVGHIPRQVAEGLARLLDGHVITVEGRMVGQNLDGAKHYKLGMDVSIYCRPAHREILLTELSWAVPAARPQVSPSKFKGKGRTLTGIEGSGSSGVGLLNAGAMDEEMRRLLDGLKRVGEDEKQADSVMDNLTADIDVSKFPLHPSPPGATDGRLLTDLLHHQSQALQWMISREHPTLPTTAKDPPVQFWLKQDNKTGGHYWLNVATRTPQKEAPELGKGGILADGMGLGKTLTILSLILETKKSTPGPTLIVCPLSVVSNWEKQIRDHVAPGKLTSYTYHGSGKGVTATTLQQYDVVITTYQTVAADFPNPPIASQSKKTKTSLGPLLTTKWRRIVADEGHVLKNPKAKMTQAFVALQAERRWVCTGTPIVNSPADLGSLLTCIQLCKPLDKVDYFRALLLRPLRNGEAVAGKLLQALVGQILLRRTKDTKEASGNHLIDLPPVEFFQVPVQLDEDTRLLYDEVMTTSRIRFQEALQGEGTTTSNVLSLLTRMRQLCLSRHLVPQSFFDELRQAPTDPSADAIAVASIPPEQQEALIEKLRRLVGDDEECAICYTAPLLHPRITDCAHAYCRGCIEEWLHRDLTCPQCRHAITMASLLALPVDSSEFVDVDEGAPSITSAKITELVKYLKVFDANDKTLVFSQFTSFLDHIAATLRDEGIAFCRFDGSMSGKQREQVIASFQTPVTPKNTDNNPRVMLISLKSGAVGLNLTAASNVFLCDPWWQSAIEAQAIDRVHRMGQRKTIRVFQLIAEDTVESKVLEIQKRKDALVAKAFEKSSKGERQQNKREARFEELKELLGV